MGITLEQLYQKTHKKYKLELLAGKSAISNEVSRVYYMEDIYVSDWTRHGELIITTAMTSKGKEGWLRKFIDSLLIYEPSGIIINIGGYLKEIPEDILKYCDKVQIPLIVFPWEIYLQDMIQEFTNLIFEVEQVENNIVHGFQNALFVPEDKAGYDVCLKRNGFGQYQQFVSVSMKIQWRDKVPEMKYVKRMLQKYSEQMIVLVPENEIIFIFYGQEMEQIKKRMETIILQCKKQLPIETLSVGIGSEADNYYNISDSYKKAVSCRKLCEKKGEEWICFEDLEVMGLLMTCDRRLLKKYAEKHLGAIRDYDQENQTSYTETLEMFIYCNGNVRDVADKLYIHRNTVNYRLKKIEQILDTRLNNMEELIKYKIAFYIQWLLLD